MDAPLLLSMSEYAPSDTENTWGGISVLRLLLMREEEIV